MTDGESDLFDVSFIPPPEPESRYFAVFLGVLFVACVLLGMNAYRTNTIEADQRAALMKQDEQKQIEVLHSEKTEVPNSTDDKR
ncbi:MAG: hypothetical protein ABGZ23_06100 [Fuerstiella sp.]|nr:hypothetical protein [Fuerstiella sp.]